jgi:hypothetical protein
LLFASASDKNVAVLIAELPVGGLPEGLVGRLAGPPKIERDGPVAARQPHRLYPNSSQIQGVNVEFNDQLRRWAVILSPGSEFPLCTRHR